MKMPPEITGKSDDVILFFSPLSGGERVLRLAAVL